MKKAIWIIGGVIFVSAAFLIPGTKGGLWKPVIFSCIAALVYLAALTWVWLKKINSNSRKLAPAGILASLIVLSTVSAFLSYSTTKRENPIISSAKYNVETSIMFSNVNEPLLQTLRYRHKKIEDGRAVTIADAFHSKFDSLITGDHELLYRINGVKNSWHIYLAKAKADSVVLIGESDQLEGKNPGYRNYSGNKGRYQVEGILTEKGVHYDRTN